MIRAAALLASIWLAGCGPKILWAGKSPDRRHRAEVVAHRGEQFVRVDGKDDPHFLSVASDGLSWSPDSSSIAYPAQTRDGWVVVNNGSASRQWSGIGEIVWSPDSAHLAYSAEDRAFWVVVKDGASGAFFDGVMKQAIVFSQNSRRFGYVVQDGRSVRVVVDEKPQPKFDGIGRFSFSADSTRFVYLARRADEAYVVTDGILSTGYESIADFALSPVGFRVAILAKIEHRWHVVVDGAVGPAFDAISSPVFDKRGQRIAYAARRSNAELVVVDGIEGPSFDAILPGSVNFDASGERLAYATRRGKTWRMVDGGVEGTEYAKIDRPHFAGKTLGFVAKKENVEFVVINGREGLPFDHIGELVLGPDGRGYAYVATKANRTFVVHDGGQVAFDVVVDETLVFSRDGLHWACLVGDATRKRFYITIDGLSERPFDGGELIAAMTRGAASGQVNGDHVRRWISAELELAPKRFNGASSKTQSLRP